MVRGQGLWRYVHRDCATETELKYYLETEWSTCERGSILHISAHGYGGGLKLSEGVFVELEQLGAYLESNCDSCLVHFSGCSILDIGERRIGEFMERTRAACVSGYTEDVGWTNRWTPAVPLELIMFSTIGEGINLNGRAVHEPLEELREDLTKRFRDCGFRMYMRKLS